MTTDLAIRESSRCPWPRRNSPAFAEAHPFLYDYSLVQTACREWFQLPRNYDDPRGNRWDWRTELRRVYSYAIPEWGAVRALLDLSPIVEIGAGNGYWAKILAGAGADVIAYDAYPATWTNNYVNGIEWFPVIHGNAFAAGMHPGRVLFLCWPPYDDPMAHDALVTHRAAGGTRVAYIGEGYGGCTADDAFHDALARDYTKTAEQSLPQWDGLHDRLLIYELEA